jgi:hypothetical protein
LWSVKLAALPASMRIAVAAAAVSARSEPTVLTVAPITRLTSSSWAKRSWRLLCVLTEYSGSLFVLVGWSLRQRGRCPVAEGFKTRFRVAPDTSSCDARWPSITADCSPESRSIASGHSESFPAGLIREPAYERLLRRTYAHAGLDCAGNCQPSARTVATSVHLGNKTDHAFLAVANRRSAPHGSSIPARMARSVGPFGQAAGACFVGDCVLPTESCAGSFGSLKRIVSAKAGVWVRFAGSFLRSRSDTPTSTMGPCAIRRPWCCR